MIKYQIKRMSKPFSGMEYYYQLDMNNTIEANNVIQKDDVKFLIHGYTDKVQFNKTGAVPFSNNSFKTWINRTSIL